MEYHKQVCSLCLKTMPNGNFEPLDDIKLKMLKIITLDLNIPVSTKPVICCKCSEVLQQSFDFKMTCLSNNDYLKTFQHPEGCVKVCLQEILLKENTPFGIKREEEKACRFCFKYFDVSTLSELSLLKEDMFFMDMLGKCLPELDLTISLNPLICSDCMELLQDQFNFIIVCLDSNNTDEGYNVPQIARCVSDIEGIEYIENIKREYDRNAADLINIKQESVEFNETEFVSIAALNQDDEFEEVPKSAYVKIDDGQCVIPDQDPLSKTTCNPQSSEIPFACPKCPHVTNRRDSLELHLLTHEEKQNVTLYKCQECDFKSKWKSSLHQHRLIHKKPGDIRMYHCALCSYQSKYKKHVRRHSKLHMDPKAVEIYRCQYCKFKSRYHDYFKMHNRVKHGKNILSVEKSYDCCKCPYETKYRSNFDAHKRSAHKIYRFVCDYESCTFKATTLGHLQDHFLKHQSSTDVEMFRCDKCEFQTKYKKSLKSHTALHEQGKTVKLKKVKGVTSN